MRHGVFLVLVGLLTACTAGSGATTTSNDESPSTTPSNTGSTTEQHLDTAGRLEALGGEPCPDSDFTCVTIEVPLDHSNPTGEVVEVVFGVLPAAVESNGVFVTATGGPARQGSRWPTRTPRSSTRP